MAALRDLEAALRARLDTTAEPGQLPAGPSLAYTLSAVVGFFLALSALTGVALSFFYAPSATDAWASVAYVEDQVSWGWLVRGLHYHGASALVIACGLHLVQAVWLGGYRKPRELAWYAGLGLMLLVLAAAITGYVLRWDQAGYWASKVEIGIAAATPLIGEHVQRLAQAGNDYGNLTVTRFHALHVAVVPALLLALALAHRSMARRHGPSPLPGRAARTATPRWPAQTARDVAVVALAFCALIAWVVNAGGAGLEAPADPTAAYDARPLWYFRWLFHLRKLMGAWETAAALVVPGIVLGFLFAMPWLDRPGAARPALRRRTVGAAFAALCLAIGGLTWASIHKDAGDAEHQEHEREAEKLAAKARRLARRYGVPAAGGTTVYQTVPMWRARTLWETQCKDCHQGDKRKGPLIEAGYGSRAWIARLLKDPSGDEFYGRSKIAKSEGAMKPVELEGDDLAAMVELVYAESGAADVDTAKAERAKAAFEEQCADCHSRDDGVSSSGPALARRGSLEHLVHFLGNPKAPIHLGEESEMPRFDKDLSVSDREALARYLLWLRTATAADVAALEPL